MSIEIEKTFIRDVVLVHNTTYKDDRGFFFEAFRADQFKEAGLPSEFVQVNQSRSKKNVIRGLHFQYDKPVGKLMRVIRGTAFLVAVDIRKGSPTFGKWFGKVLSDTDPTHLYAPAGCARGFCALSDMTDVQYLTTNIYNPKGEGGICFDDPDIAVAWPTDNPLVSEKDRMAPSFREWQNRAESDLFLYD